MKVYLEVYDYSKDEDCGEKVHQVGQVLSVEGFTESADLVLSGCQQVEQCNDSTFEFSTTA